MEDDISEDSALDLQSTVSAFYDRNPGSARTERRGRKNQSASRSLAFDDSSPPPSSIASLRSTADHVLLAGRIQQDPLESTPMPQLPPVEATQSYAKDALQLQLQQQLAQQQSIIQQQQEQMLQQQQLINNAAMRVAALEQSMNHRESISSAPSQPPPSVSRPPLPPQPPQREQPREQLINESLHQQTISEQYETQSQLLNLSRRGQELEQQQQQLLQQQQQQLQHNSMARLMAQQHAQEIDKQKELVRFANERIAALEGMLQQRDARVTEQQQVYTAALQEITNRYKKQQHELTTARTTLMEAHDELVQVKARVEDREQTLEDAETELYTTRENLEDAQQELNILRDDLSDRDKKLTAVEDKLKQALNAVDDARIILEERQAEIEVLRAELRDKEKSLAQRESEMMQLRDNKSSLESGVRQMHTQLVQVQEQLQRESDKRHNMDAAVMERDELRTLTDHYKQEVDDLQNTVASLTVQLEAAKESNEELERKLAADEVARHELLQTHVALEMQHEELQSTVRSAREAYEIAEQRLLQIPEYEKRVEQERQQRRKTEQAYRKLQDELTATKITLEATQQELASEEAKSRQAYIDAEKHGESLLAAAAQEREEIEQGAMDAAVKLHADIRLRDEKLEAREQQLHNTRVEMVTLKQQLTTALDDKKVAVRNLDAERTKSAELMKINKELLATAKGNERSLSDKQSLVAKSDARCREIEAREDQLKRKVTELNTMNKQLVETLKLREKAAEDKQAIIVTMSKTDDEQKVLITELHSINSKLSETMKRMERTIMDKDAIIRSTDQLTQQHQLRVRELSEQIQALTSERDLIRAEHSRVSVQLDEVLKRSTVQLDEMMHRNNQLQLGIEEVRTFSRSKEEDADKMRQQVEHEREEIASLKRTRDEQARQLEQANAKIESIEQQLQLSYATQTELQTRLQQLAEELRTSNERTQQTVLERERVELHLTEQIRDEQTHCTQLEGALRDQQSLYEEALQRLREDVRREQQRTREVEHQASHHRQSVQTITAQLQENIPSLNVFRENFEMASSASLARSKLPQSQSQQQQLQQQQPMAASHSALAGTSIVTDAPREGYASHLKRVRELQGIISKYKQSSPARPGKQQGSN
eukprot:TRINITY_DN11262_c0_g1_i1.p1 TRINITY_DN11262_c0_g1~~TRINITY_DN11262_c0_g1_i1.p1  ORF type:complete len:1183 (-),score=392.49 TRINITY_DN11262_c0_g1_i1:55-3414(-)